MTRCSRARGRQNRALPNKARIVDNFTIYKNSLDLSFTKIISVAVVGKNKFKSR